MIKIMIPNNFIPERSYVIDILLGEMAGLEYGISISTSPDYQLLLPNGKRLIIRDHFFANFDEANSYLFLQNIPATVPYVTHRFTDGLAVPMIYGDHELKVEPHVITCGLDIFASAFFMLSRWEECVVKAEDYHRRFPVSAALAFKNGFLNKPVVNFYLVMLRCMLEYLGYYHEKAGVSFSFVLTHDVDALLKWLDWSHVWRTISGDLFKRHQLGLSIQRLQEFRAIRQGKQPDPFDSYDLLMDEAELLGTRARFYFMSSRPSRAFEDNHSPYSPFHSGAQRIFARIKSRGHIIGFHPGYTTYNNKELWQVQRAVLQNASGCLITEGRQHYLRFQVPDTWQLWADMGMVLDSTCAYSACEGFRCGTGHTYSVFNILTRQKLKLKEQPLIFMDTATNTTGWEPNSPTLNTLFSLIETARNVDTPITLLFHNSTFADQSVLPAYQKIIHS